MNLKVDFPEHLSEDCLSCIKGFFITDPKERLGCGKNGLAKLKSHPWFKSIDFELLENKQLKPPFIPTSKDKTSNKFFDQDCINSNVNDSNLVIENENFQQWS